ncbi:hypothetical protein QT972_09775 [Microcoleus sp. herbarium7]|uniref:hypothetical protein n=1 Tax=Microcoleus sp. herbarium7 TaxID=3055435 RepID=UPI002FD39EE1
MKAQQTIFPPTPSGSAIAGAFFMSDQYGLESNFKFAASNSSFSQMDRVIALLEGIEKATKETAQSITSTHLGKDLMKSLNADGVKREGKEIQGAVKAITNTLSPLKSEFRALRAESRNIDFGEMTDTRQFKKASGEISRYIKKLKELEGQISGDSTGDREFKASLRSQQRVAGDKVKLAKASRDAGMASERLGFSQAIQGVGQGVVNSFADPLAAAGELQKSLAGVKKLADDLSESGTRTLQNEVFNLSAKLAVEDTKVSSIFEDLAGSGKKFGDEMGGVGTRIAEVEQILKNQQALDISSGVATQLDVTLGSIYKNLVSKDPNAIVELNARVASSVNELADKLSDVRISAEDVIPVMNVVMNTVGDAANFPVDQIAAYSAAIASLGTIEPEAAGSFFNRLSAKMSENTVAFAGALNMTSEQFNKKLNTDKLGVVTDLAEAYKNVQGGELAKGSFFSSIGIGSVQDQKLLQGLANNLDTLKSASVVAQAGFMKKEVTESIDTAGKKVLSLGDDLKQLSIDKEVANVLQTSAFQSQRFDASMKALKDTLGSAVLEVITPFKSLASDVIGIFIHLTQIAPGLTKVLAALTFGLGTLAVVAGGVGVALFTFQQAQAIATTAAITMQSSLIPLTGFFQTAMSGFSGTFPWKNVLRQSTVVADELAVAASGAKGLITGELRTGLIALRSQVMLTSQAALGMARAFMMSPLGIAVGVILLLDQILQQANPKVRLLGTLFSIVSSAAGFAFGIVEGFVSAFLKLLNVPVGAAGGLLSSPFKAIAEALDFAMVSFRNWERSGKHIGETIFNIMATPFVFAATMAANAWGKTISFISGLLKPLADFAAYIGHFIQGSLSEASPGPSYNTRKNWALTAVSVTGSMIAMSVGALFSGERIQQAMTVAAAWVTSVWHTAVEKISSAFAGFSLPETLTNFATELGNAWTNTFTMLTSGWLNFVSTFTSATPDFGGLAFAGMAAMKPLLAWGLPDIVSEKFDNIVAPKTPTPAPQVLPQVVAPRQQESIAQTTQPLAPPPQTETIWEQMWNRIGDLTQQGIAGVRGAIETNLGGGAIAFFDKLGAITATFFQNLITITDAFKGQSGNIFTPLVEGALIFWELGKAVGGLSKEFMGFEEGFLHKVIDNFNILGFTALMLSSMLMNLVSVPFEALRSLPGLLGQIVGGITSFFGLGNQKLLEEGASKYVSFLKVFDRPGIGTALAKGLPGIVAILMGLNVFEDLTQLWTATLIGWSNTLPQIVEGIVTNIEGILNSVEPYLLPIFPEGINIFPEKEVRDQVYATLGEVGAMFATFWQNIADSAGKVGDAIKPIFAAIATVKIMTVPQLFANYMGFGDAVQPVTDFIHSLPLLGMPIAEFTVIEAAIGAILDLLRSPTLSGFVGFLTGPLFNALVAIGKTFFTLGSTIAIAFLGIPIFIAKNALEKARIAGEATRKGLLDPLARGATVAKQAVVDRLKLLPGIISGLLRKLPAIGTFIANAFDIAMSGIGKVFVLAQEALPGYLDAMRSQLGVLKTAFVGLGGALQGVGSSLVGAAKYIINEALIPLGEAIGFLNPFKLIALYAQTKGLQGVTKGVNPIDLAVTGIDDALIAVSTKLGAFGKLEGEALKTAQGAFRPLSNLLSGSVTATAHNISEQAKNVAGAVAGGTGEAIDRAFPIRVLSAKLLAVRKTYLSTKAALAYDKAYVMGFNLGPVIENFVLMRAIFVPMLQVVARAAFSWMTYYTVLEAFTPTLLNTIDAFARAHTELGFISKIILGTTFVLRVLRFAVVDTTNAVIAFSTTFFKTFQIIAPIVGKAAGIIAYGIGLMIKAVTLGTQILGATLLLPVIAVSKMMQGVLITIRYLGMKVRGEVLAFGNIFSDLGHAISQGDFIGGLWAIAHLAFKVLPMVVGGVFVVLAKYTTGALLVFGGVLLSVAKDAIMFFLTSFVPYVIGKAQAIGIAITTGIVEGTKFGISNFVPTVVAGISKVDRAIAGAGSVAANAFGAATENLMALRIWAAALIPWTGAIVIGLVELERRTGIFAAALRGIMGLFSGGASFAFLPWLAALSGVVFLAWQLQDGFKELDAIIVALNNPVKWLRDSLSSISKTFSTGINTDGIAFVVEKLVRVLPIALGAIFLIGFAVKKHIFGGFMLIWDVVKGIANSLIGAIRMAKSIPGSVAGIGTEGRVLEGVHKVRSVANLYRDPQAKAAREDEFKLAKESAMFLQKIREKSQAEIVTLAQQQKTDYGHMAKQVDVKKGGFFGIGARNEKEWQLTGAGEEFQRKRLAETHEAKVGIFGDREMKAIAQEVSPARLGMMQSEELRSIFGKDRPDLAALGKALDTVKIMNVAQMNVSRTNNTGELTEKDKKNAGFIQYRREDLENFRVQGLDKNKNSFSSFELKPEQLYQAVRKSGTSEDQMMSLSQFNKSSANTQSLVKRLMQFQLAANTGKLKDSPAASSVAGVNFLAGHLDLDSTDRSTMSGDRATFKASISEKIDKIKSAGYLALDGYRMEDLLSEAQAATTTENYNKTIQKYLGKMMEFQVENIQRGSKIDPSMFKESGALLGGDAASNSVSHGLKGILTELMGGIGQAVTNVSKKLPGYREGYSLKAIAAIERQIAGAAPLPDQRAQDSRRSRLEASLKQLRSGRLDATAQQDIVAKMASMLQKDVYELTNPLLKPGQLNSRLEQAKAERAKLFDISREGQNQAFKDWMKQFNPYDQKRIAEQLREGNFKGGALKGRGEDISRNGKIEKTYVNYEGSLARALGLENIEQVEQAFSTEAIMSRAQKGWKAQLAQIIGNNNEASLYNNQIDELRNSINQRVARQEAGFAEREARRNTASAGREMGFVAQLNQVALTRQAFMARLDATQKAAFDKFLQSGKFQTEVPEAQFENMAKKLGFVDSGGVAQVEKFKDFQKILARSENQKVAAYFQSALTNVNKFSGSAASEMINGADGVTPISQMDRLREVMAEANVDARDISGVIQTIRTNGAPGQNEDTRNAWGNILEYMQTGQSVSDLTVDQIAEIGRHMELQGDNSQIAAQLRAIGGLRNEGSGSLADAFKVFIKNIETDAKSVEQWVSDRLTALETWSPYGGWTPLAGFSRWLQNSLFNPITKFVQGAWTWLGTAVKSLGAKATALRGRATGMLASLPGVRTFAAARQRRETDSGASLQVLSSKMGYANQEEFAQKFKDAMTARGISDSRMQNKALQAILNSNSTIGVAESLRSSRSQEIVDNSDKIGEALAHTLGRGGSAEDIAKLLMPGGFTTRALAPMRNYLFGAVFPAIWDVASAPLKAVVGILMNPQQSFNTVKSAASRVADAVSDFMVGTYTNVRKVFAATTAQLSRVPLFGKIWGAVSSFFGKIGAKIQGLAAPATAQRIRGLQSERRGNEQNLVRSREGSFPAEQLPDAAEIQRLNDRITTLSQVRTQAIARLNPFQKLLLQATNAAGATKRAWAQTAEEISQTGWRGLVARFKRIGYLMQRNISEGSPGPSADTRANWEHTQQSVSANMGEMAQSAQVAGQQIQGDMQRTARRSVGFFGALHGAVSGAGKAGMAVGGAITAVGFAAQTASYSLVNMGLLDEASAAKLNKFLEIFTLVGAVGGLMAPVMGAIVSSVTAIGSAFALIFNPVTLTMGAITAGLFLANEGLKRFAGIDLLGPIMTNVQGPIAGAIAFVQEKIDQVFVWLNDKFGTQLSPILEPLGAAVTTIKGAWQGFVDWFVAMPLVQTAIDIGTGLINALNHNPTVQIPLAWEGAIENIKGMLFGLPFVGDLIASLMKDSLDPTKILGNLFEGFHSMLDQLESSGLARFGGGKLLDGLKGFLGGFGKKKTEVATEIPVEAGVKLNYKDALASAIKQADFDARSGSATAQAASANLQYQMQTTGGEMDANQLGAVYQGAGGEFLQRAIAKQNNRLFVDQGSAGKEKRVAIEQELQALNQKEVELQTAYTQAIGKAQVATAAPAPTNFLESLIAGGSNNVSVFTAQAATASKAMTDLQAQRATLQQQAVIESVVFDAGTDQMLKNMGVDPDGLIVAVAEAKTAISTGITEVGFVISDRWNYLERSNGGNLSAMMETDLQKAGGAFRILKGDVVDFAQKAATALQKMDWAGFTEASGDFWNNLTFGLGQAASGFAGAGLSAIMFYVHLSPIAFILGAVALAGLAIATNFLGMRSILMGIIRVFTGFAQVAVSSVMMVMNVIRGMVKVVGGIPAAISGDFRQMGEGLEVVWSGIKEGARGLLRGLSSIFGGGLEVLGGLFQGLRQTIGVVFGPALINSAREAVTAIKQLFESAGETITSALKKPGQVLDGIANRFRKGKEQVADSPIGRTVGAIAEVASGKAPNMDAARVAHDFDMKMRGKDPGAELTAGDRARLAQSQMESVLSSGFDTSRHLGTDVLQPSTARSSGVLSDIDNELRAAESGLGSMRDRSVSAADAVNNALSSLGIALSSFAPALAAPLFLVGDLLSGFTGLSMALPQLGVLFPGVATAITGFTTALSAGTFTVSGTMVGFGAAFTGVMTGISAAASTAWIAISGPLLPILVLLGALAIGFLMFKTNFMGFGDFISGVFSGVGDALSGIWQGITEGIAEIGSMMGEIGGYLLKPLEPLFRLFGIDTGGGSAGGLQAAVISGAINAALLPIRAIGLAIQGIIWSVFAIVKAVLWLGGLVVQAILAPITLVSNAIALIVRGFQALGSIIGTVLMAPFQFLQMTIQWIWDKLTQLPIFLGQALASIPFIGPLLQNLGGSLFQTGAQTPVQQFASGGHVVGPGSGTADRIPAMLSNGEFVVSAGPAQENLGMLTALNEGRSIEVMPMPSPTRIPVAVMGGGRSADSESAPMQMPPVQINVNLNGDVVLSGGNSAADAQEFLTKIEPYLQQAVWGMFRNWVDFNR